MLHLGTLNFDIVTTDGYTNKVGKAMKYEGEIHKVLKKAYGKGKVTHVARPDMSWEGHWIENKRSGFST